MRLLHCRSERRGALAELRFQIANGGQRWLDRLFLRNAERFEGLEQLLQLREKTLHGVFQVILDRLIISGSLPIKDLNQLHIFNRER